MWKSRSRQLLWAGSIGSHLEGLLHSINPAVMFEGNFTTELDTNLHGMKVLHFAQ
jgi:hypothetical protein